LGNIEFKPFTPTHMNNNGTANILVVDDDLDVAKTIKLILEKMGQYNVFMALSGAECLRLVEEELPDLILLDIHMPEVDGINVLRQLRARPETKEIPILIVSVDAQLERLIDCFEAGANGFLIKPFDAANLYQQVRSAIAQHRVNMLQRDTFR